MSNTVSCAWYSTTYYSYNKKYLALTVHARHNATYHESELSSLGYVAMLNVCARHHGAHVHD